MRPLVFNSLTAHVSVTPMKWATITASKAYIVPIASAFANITMSRYTETANLFSLLRHLIGGNSLSIIISLNANDRRQLDKQIRFQITLLILYTEIMAVPAIAAHYRDEIDRDPDLKLFFNTIIGHRYIKSNAYYKQRYDTKPAEPPENQSFVESTLNKTSDFVKSINQFVINLVKDISGIIIITTISATLSHIFGTSFKPLAAGRGSNLESSYQSRQFVSPEVLLGYANWKQILNTSLYSALIGETLFKMHTNMNLSPTAWGLLNPFIDYYWTFLKFNIIMTMKLQKWTGSVSSDVFLSNNYINPIFTTEEAPVNIDVGSYLSNPMVAPLYASANLGDYPSIAIADLIAEEQFQKQSHTKINIYDKAGDPLFLNTGIHLPYANEESEANPNTVPPMDKLESSAFIVPCCNYTATGQSGCIQGLCNTKSIPASCLEYLGLDPDLANSVVTEEQSNLNQSREESGLAVFDDILKKDSYVAAGELSMTDVWNRVAEIYVTQDSLTDSIQGYAQSNQSIAAFSLEQKHSLEFKVTLSNDTNADTAIVTVYNIQKSTKQAIIPEKSRILIKSGYSQDFCTIFEGFVTDIYDTRIGADTATTIIAYNDMLKLQRAPANIFNIAAQETYDSVIAKLMGQVGIPVGVIKLDELYYFEKPTVLSGSPYMNLQSIARMTSALSGLEAQDWYTHPDSYTFYIQDNVGYFVPRKYISPTKVSVKTGRGKYGGLISASKTQDPYGLTQAEIVCIMNPRIKPDVEIDLDSITLGQNTYKVYEVSHVCSRDKFVTTAKIGKF